MYTYITVEPRHLIGEFDEDKAYPRIECEIRGSLTEDYPIFEIVTVRDNRVIFTGTDAQITEFIGSDVWAIGDVIFW